MTGILLSLLGSTFGGAAVSDPYFEYTTLLLPGNGTNGAQNNTFLDSSTNNFTITRNGNTTQGTFSPFSQTGWGNYFNGSSQYLSVAHNAAFDYGSGDVTLECWVYLLSTSNMSIVHKTNAGSDTPGNIALRVESGKFQAFVDGNDAWPADLILTGATTVAANQWYHVALVRNGSGSNNWVLYVNGNSDATGTYTGSTTNAATPMYIGFWRSGDPTYLNAYLSNLRIVKGRAVYTSAFTPPTSPLGATSGGQNPPQGTETSLLTCQSNRFVDNSTNNFTITPNGSPSVQAFSPFNPSASWSAATYGGSGYFDGNGDSLSAASNAAFAIGTGDFSIECWIYFLGTARGGGASGEFFGSTTAGSIVLRYLSGTLALSRVGTADDMSASVTLTTGQWYHICATRTGTTGGLYLNGDRVATNSSYTASYAQGEMQCISGTNGYFSSCRLVKGSNPYGTGSTITVPTAPLTAITNTSLLLNYTNAGIYDATSKNDLETVGDAKISTAQSKWGGSSMAFDGTGDYLLAPSSQYIAFPGDFTFECWLYRTASTGEGTLFYNTTSGGINIFMDVSGTWGIGRSGVAVDNNFGSTPSTNTWNHIAVSRSGSTIKAFVNGTQVFSGTNTQSYVAGPVQVGLSGYGTITGYLQDLRITKYARYTSNFTAPTAAFPTL